MQPMRMSPATRALMAAAMTDPSSPELLRLMTWLSPAFPVGAFAYSHGLERAVHDGFVNDRATLTAWISDLLTCGSGWNDAVLLAAAWREMRSGDGDVGHVAELADALAGSRERHMETVLQGGAFAEAVAAWTAAAEQVGVADTPYPVAVGAAAGAHGIGLEPVLAAYLHAFASSMAQAAMRLVPLGQTDGVATMAALETAILNAAARAARSSLDDLGSATFISDIAAMRHEMQYSRVFRS